MIDGRSQRIVASHLHLQNRRIADDRRKDVAEIMGDPPRKLSEGLHLLGLEELLFELLLFRYVVRDLDDRRDPPRRVPQGKGLRLDVRAPSLVVMAGIDAYRRRGAPCLEGLMHRAPFTHFVAWFREMMSGFIAASPDHLGLGFSDKLAISPVCGKDCVVPVDDDEPFVHAFENVSYELFRSLALPSHPGFDNFALDRRDEAPEVVLHDVVVGSGLHGLDRHVLADRARDDDEGEVELLFLYELESGESAEMGHAVIGDYGVPRAVVECRLHLLCGLDAARAGLIAAALQLPQEEHRVVFGILYDQDTKAPCGIFGHFISPSRLRVK